ncbi:MAG TPA: hypothetical protein RMH80_05980, partial [Polyangiaceae bacterium LLY-WYZ-15_(1-7)]|nr:hypothetical protein [Polyangiaceae bacterium LLY-WYZ-15_(1-7)]
GLGPTALPSTWTRSHRRPTLRPVPLLLERAPHDAPGLLLRVRASGAITVEEMDAHFRELEALARATTGPVGAIIDAREVELKALRGAHRDCAVGHLKRLRPLIEERYRAQAFVLASAWGRALVGMLHLFVKPAERTRSFARPAPAERWVRAQLEG